MRKAAEPRLINGVSPVPFSTPRDLFYSFYLSLDYIKKYVYIEKGKVGACGELGSCPNATRLCRVSVDVMRLCHRLRLDFAFL